MNHHDLPQKEPACGPTAPPAAAQDPSDQLNALLVDEIECGLVVCDGHGMLSFANRCARQELASGLLLRMAGGQLECTDGESHDLHTALWQAVTKGRRQLVQLQAAGHRLLVSVTPLQAPAGGPTLALLVLGRRRPCSELALEMLAKVYHLTWAERRVLSALMGEVSARDIASQHRVALSTVRSQIKSLREKMGAPNIDSLLLRAAEMPPIASALRLVDGGAVGPAGAGAPRRAPPSVFPQAWAA